MHIPVLLQEILQGFDSCYLFAFFDGTIGLAGHAEAILEAHPEIVYYVGCDKDKNALLQAKKRLEKWEKKLFLHQGSFTKIKEIMQKEKIKAFSGILFDFGVSSMQLDDPKRGFSFRGEGPLDMRMDQNSSVSAEEVVNKFSEKKLGEIFRSLGEERNWKRIAKAIVRAREKERIKTTKQLKEIIESTYLRRSKKHLHPATLAFQALRIFVNRELEDIQDVIVDAADVLEEKGKMGAISFHSGEDRIVKNAFREVSRGKAYTVLTKKPIVPTPSESRKNPRSRSAKLRWLQKEVGA